MKTHELDLLGAGLLVKFPHSPYYIMHSVLEKKKQRQKQYIAIGKTNFVLQ